MKLIVERLNHLSSNRALLVVHHTAKPSMMPGAGTPTPSQAGRGSGYLGGEMDANWLLSSHRDNRRLEIESRFAAELPPIAILQDKLGLWRVGQQPASNRPPTQRWAALSHIQDYLAVNPTPTYTEALNAVQAVDASISTDTFKRAWALHQQAQTNAGTRLGA